MMRRAALAVLALGIAIQPQSLLAYLKAGITSNGQTLSVRWPQLPVRYFVRDASVPGVTASQFRDAVARAFQTWHDVPSAAVDFTFVGFTAAEPGDQDNANTLGFLNRPDLERTIAATNYLVDTRTGDLLEADIFFNDAFAWSVADAGEPGRYDVQSLATHEIGHFLGLGHSAIGETELGANGDRRLIAAGSVMFPIAFFAGDITSRTLCPDDIAGVSDIYPSASFRAATGSIQGTVTKSGRGIFGAHVVAFSLSTGALIGGFSLDASGSFTIGGVPPGSYILRVEPLDDGDLVSFFDDTASVDTNFRVAFYPNIVSVPAGGSPPAVAVSVTPK